MNHLNLKFYVCTLFGFMSIGLNAQTIHLNKSDGSQVTWNISSVKKMTFSSGTVSVFKVDNTTGTFQLSGLSSLQLEFYDLPTFVNDTNVKADYGHLRIYPNPVTNVLNLDISGMKGKGASIRIYSLDGKLIYTSKITEKNIIAINTSAFPKGVYTCCYIDDVETKMIKFIKQ